MNKILHSAFILLAIACQVSGQSNNQSPELSLFERLGGSEGIAAIVDGAVEAHLNNPVIKARFSPYLKQPERLAVIRQHTIEFFSAGGGGPVEYTGGDMTTTHVGMNINAIEYMAVVDDIMGVIDKRGVDDESKKDVLSILWSLKEMIMGQ